MELSPMEVIFLFLGGLGIFLYGIKQMGDGLQASAGDRLREILNRMTSMLGDNIGTTITAVLAALVGSIAAKNPEMTIAFAHGFF